MKQYKDIFIDFDDTLYNTRGNAITALKELFNDLQLGRYFEDENTFYDSYWKTNIELWGQYAKGEIERDVLIVERFRRPLAVGNGLNPTREYCLQVSDYFLDLCAVKSGVIEGAHELVEYLRHKGYRLHICSNGFHEVQYKKLKASNFQNDFNTIILSEDAGANKPSCQFFDYALKKSGAEKETTIMIGDNYNTDIIGAMNSGIDTILFNRWDPTFTPPQQPTYIVDKLLDITQVL